MRTMLERSATGGVRFPPFCRGFRKVTPLEILLRELGAGMRVRKETLRAYAAVLVLRAIPR
jgi:hypothetical protein